MTVAVAGALSAAEEAPAEFLAAWLRAGERPEQAAEQWQSFAEAHREHDLGRLATLLRGIALLREDASAAQLEQAEKCFRFELPGTDTPAPTRTERRRPGQALRQGNLPAHLRPADARGKTLGNGLRNGAASEAGGEADQPDADSTKSTFQQHLAWAGKGWIARVGMVRLDRQLRSHYRRNVQYPASLDELAQSGASAATAADLVDPFAKPYVYEATARKLIPDVPRQAYTLECSTTGASQLQLRQVLPDAFEPIPEVAISTLTPDSQSAFVRRTRKDGSFGPVQHWPVGETKDGLTLWAVYANFIVIGQSDVPKIVEAAPKDPKESRTRSGTRTRRRRGGKQQSPTAILKARRKR